MAIHIKSFEVDGFRGLTDLDIKNLNHINIITGDNNSGKTSVLEALSIFDNPSSLINILYVSRMRNNSYGRKSSSNFENFLNLFSKNQNNLKISSMANYEEFSARYEISGNPEKIILDPSELENTKYKYDSYLLKNKSLDELNNVSAFSGELISSVDDKSKTEKIEINEYLRVSFLSIARKRHLKLPKVVYLSPMAHVLGDNFDGILENNTYKKICIEILKIFDPDINDLLYLKSEYNNTTLEYISHNKFGNMPINTYGDGIKKVISLANAIAKAQKGILLIDEVETAIHAKHYDDIFSFLVKAALQFDVQIFITSHSQEVIDSFLRIQDYENKESDEISVITLKKEECKTCSRVLTGRQAYSNREKFDFEVRL